MEWTSKFPKSKDHSAHTTSSALTVLVCRSREQALNENCPHLAYSALGERTMNLSVKGVSNTSPREKTKKKKERNKLKPASVRDWNTELENNWKLKNKLPLFNWLATLWLFVSLSGCFTLLSIWRSEVCIRLKRGRLFFKVTVVLIPINMVFDTYFVLNIHCLLINSSLHKEWKMPTSGLYVPSEI